MSQIVNNRPGRFRQIGGKLEVALDKALLSGEAFAMIGAPPKGGTEAPLPANAVRLRRGSRPQREEAAKILQAEIVQRCPAHTGKARDYLASSQALAKMRKPGEPRPSSGPVAPLLAGASTA